MPSWWQEPYRGGGPAKVKGLPRNLYPPSAKNKGKTPSKPGPDVKGIKRTISRCGRWPWQEFDEEYSDKFALGNPSSQVANSGVAGFQRQQGIQDTGWIGPDTFSALRYALVSNPEAQHYGEQAMDSVACDLINEAWEMFQGKPPRDLAMEHQKKRVGYTEQPANSNCDSRSDGICTAQDHTASGTWLRGEPWCGCWCYYALETAGVAKLDSHLASVAQIEDYARKGAKCYRGWTTDRGKVKKGDLVIVGGYGVHVEMVRGFDGSTTLTYGGNTSPGSSGSQSNGGGAYSRERNPSEVRGYALVRYPGE